MRLQNELLNIDVSRLNLTLGGRRVFVVLLFNPFCLMKNSTVMEGGISFHCL